MGIEELGVSYQPYTIIKNKVMGIGIEVLKLRTRYDATRTPGNNHPSRPLAVAPPRAWTEVLRNEGPYTRIPRGQKGIKILRTQYYATRTPKLENRY